MAYLSIVIPAYNEEATIGKTLANYCKFFSSKTGKIKKDFEIIVVTDGSKDRTPEIVREFGKAHKEVRLLHFRQRLGKGGAVIEGFRAAKGEIIGFTDGDESVTAPEFWKLVEALDWNAAAIASRYVKGAKVLQSEPLKVIFAGRVFNLIVNALFFLGIHDTQCGAKVFRGDVAKAILPKMITTDFSFDVEMLWRAKKLGRVVEVPIVWSHSLEGSKTRLRNSHKLLLSVLKVRLQG